MGASTEGEGKPARAAEPYTEGWLRAQASARAA